jgi:hypothetical protein
MDDPVKPGRFLGCGKLGRENEPIRAGKADVGQVGPVGRAEGGSDLDAMFPVGLPGGDGDLKLGIGEGDPADLDGRRLVARSVDHEVLDFLLAQGSFPEGDFIDEPGEKMGRGGPKNASDGSGVQAGKSGAIHFFRGWWPGCRGQLHQPGSRQKGGPEPRTT